MKATDWFGRYSSGWQKEIVPEAFSHPAKFARGLIRHIYEYVLEQGYLREGDTVLDPFGGVALGALDAMVHGLHYISIELEERFVQLGQQNIDLWNRRYGGGKLRRWGTATILQGDSRNLVEVLEGARVKGLISSPPFSPDQPCASQTQAIKDYHAFTRGDGTKRDHVMRSAGNIGNMPTGEPPQAIIGSPPHATSEVVQSHGRSWRVELDEAEGSWRNIGSRYGDQDGQLGMMREGDVDAVIASPPFADSQQSTDADFVLDSTKVNPTPRKLGDCPYFPAEMESDGQLAALPEGEPPAGIVSSPPWEQSIGDAADTPQTKRIRPHLPNAKIVAAYLREKRIEKGLSPQEIDEYMETVTLYSWYEGRPAGIQIPTPGNWLKLKSLLGLDDRFDYGILTEIEIEATSKNTVSKTGHSRMQDYGSTVGNLGNKKGDTFWAAARAILRQCHWVLAPDGVAIWVLKAFVRNKAIVDFPGQWRTLCESCGFETVEVIRAWLVEARGAQFALNGDLVERKVARKSFFRRLYERKARAAKFWLSVPRLEQAAYLWQAHNRLWQEYNTGMGSPEPSNIRPTHVRITSSAQVIAYRAAGEPDIETDTQIDYEIVLVTRKI